MYNIKTSPNQKIITIKKEKTDKENFYARINLNALERAAQNLKGGGFKLWIYFAKNQDNYTFALSAVEACRFCNFGKTTYHAAVQELIDVGYLVNTNGNHYDFYEELRETEEAIVTIHKNSYIKN